MQASFDELYRGDDRGGANEATIHVMRGDPANKWADPFAYNAFYPDLPKINNEPAGPGASAGAEGWTADLVAQDFQRTINAGWPLYVGHCEWIDLERPSADGVPTTAGAKFG